MRWLLCASVLLAMTGCHALYITSMDASIIAAQPIDTMPAQQITSPAEYLPEPVENANAH